MRRMAGWTATYTAGLLLALIALAIQPVAAQVPRDALLRFEENVKWAAVSGDWAGQRDGWIASVRSANSAAEVGAALLKLEAAMGWDAVEDSWRGRRDGWVSDVQGAQTNAAVARALLELEAATKWSAVEPAWRGSRDEWVAGLNGIR